MTIITREDPTDLVVRPVRPRARHRCAAPATDPPPGRGRRCRTAARGVLMSRASHRRRPITPVATVLLALVAAAITVWLGLVAQLGGASDAPAAAASVPGRLAVVQVQTGESLQQLAQRVAPDAPTGAVVDQIRRAQRTRLGRGRRRADPDRARRLIRDMRRETSLPCNGTLVCVRRRVDAAKER